MKLIELDIVVRGHNTKSPLVSRLFFDKESGGISTMPVLAERGTDKDTALAKEIAHQINRGHYQNIVKD
jgi:hypothetical protein